MADGHLSQLSIVVYDGHYDKIHYALAMASAAAALDSQVTLFFTMDAARSLMRPDDSGGQAAWRALPVSQGDGNGGTMDDGFAADKIGTFEDLLSACKELGVTFMVCEMGLKARGLHLENLRDDIDITSGGLVTFLSNAHADGSVVFI